MSQFTTSDALSAAKRIRLNWHTVLFSLDDLVKGMNVELEHGTIIPELDVTGDDPILTAKIALAHLFEDPRYYKYLEIIENAKYKKMIDEMFDVK